MFRRSLNSVRACAAAIVLAAAASAPAYADPPAPMVMGPLYSEPGILNGTPDPTCAVTIAELSDPRRAPEILGMMGNRSIVAPPDRMAWIRSVFEVGLRARGFDVTFAEPSAPAPAEAENAPETVATAPSEPLSDTIALRITVRSIWLSTVGMNKNATVVLQVAQSRGAQMSERAYRGSVVLANWAGTRSESNGALERAFARALDEVAADVRLLCGGAG